MEILIIRHIWLSLALFLLGLWRITHRFRLHDITNCKFALGIVFIRRSHGETALFFHITVARLVCKKVKALLVAQLVVAYVCGGWRLRCVWDAENAIGELVRDDFLGRRIKGTRDLLTVLTLHERNFSGRLRYQTVVSTHLLLLIGPDLSIKIIFELVDLEKLGALHDPLLLRLVLLIVSAPLRLINTHWRQRRGMFVRRSHEPPFCLVSLQIQVNWIGLGELELLGSVTVRSLPFTL